MVGALVGVVLLAAGLARAAAAEQAAHWQQCGWGGGGFYWSCAFHPAREGVIYLGGDVGGVYVTEDGGEHWRFANDGLANYAVYALAVDPASPDTVYAGTEGGICKSTDAAAHWKLLAATAPGALDITSQRGKSVRNIAVDPADSRVVYAGTVDGRILRSADGGEGWSVAYEIEGGGQRGRSGRLRRGPEARPGGQHGGRRAAQHRLRRHVAARRHAEGVHQRGHRAGRAPGLRRVRQGRRAEVCGRRGELGRDRRRHRREVRRHGRGARPVRPLARLLHRQRRLERLLLPLRGRRGDVDGLARRHHERPVGHRGRQHGLLEPAGQPGPGPAEPPQPLHRRQLGPRRQSRRRPHLARERPRGGHHGRHRHPLLRGPHLRDRDGRGAEGQRGRRGELASARAVEVRAWPSAAISGA